MEVDFEELRDALFQEVRKIHRVKQSGDHANLAKKLGVNKGSLHRLENGSDMRASSLIKLMDWAGIDLSGVKTYPGELRELSIPGSEKARERSAWEKVDVPKKIATSGFISAGHGLIEPVDEDDPDYAEYSNLQEVFEHHPLWRLGDGEMTLIGIRGESMMPRFKPNSLLAARRVGYEVDLSAIPIGSFVVLQDTGHDGDMTFKIFDYIEDDGEIIRIIGRAVNEDYELMKMKPDEVRVSHIVYGAIDKLI